MLLLLSSCSGASLSTPEAFCRAQSYRDPAVKALIVASVSTTAFHGQPELDAAIDSATKACLRRQGILPKGGGVAAPATPRGDTLFTF